MKGIENITVNKTNKIPEYLDKTASPEKTYDTKNIEIEA